MEGKDIEQLIPQRPPIVMVDELVAVEGDIATTTLAIRSDNYFADSDGTLVEAGLIEHIAQSASAFAGYKALANGAADPPVGYIGEIKKFRCSQRPSVGERLHTTIVFGPEASGVRLISGESRVGEEVVAATQMKIFLQPTQ